MPETKEMKERIEQKLCEACGDENEGKKFASALMLRLRLKAAARYRAGLRITQTFSSEHGVENALAPPPH